MRTPAFTDVWRTASLRRTSLGDILAGQRHMVRTGAEHCKTGDRAVLRRGPGGCGRLSREGAGRLCGDRLQRPVRAGELHPARRRLLPDRRARSRRQPVRGVPADQRGTGRTVVQGNALWTRRAARWLSGDVGSPSAWWPSRTTAGPPSCAGPAIRSGRCCARPSSRARTTPRAGGTRRKPAVRRWATSVSRPPASAVWNCPLPRRSR